MLKNDIKIKKQNGVNYLYQNGEKLKFKPWLGDIFCFLYDSIMQKSIFSKKFNASIQKHKGFLTGKFEEIHNKNILELATGSGDMSEIIPQDNTYTGIDISAGLLKIAFKKFSRRGFDDFELFVCSAKNLPFENDWFDICVCNLSLNFFADLQSVITEIKRVLKKKATLYCSIPVPEKNKNQRIIRGNLYSQRELKETAEKHKFIFNPYNIENGALFYFSATSTT